MFFTDKIDSRGKRLKYETVGVMAKEIDGGPYLQGTDLGVYQANNKVAIVVEQRLYKKSKTVSNTKRTIMFDQLNCETWDK
ncbi:hypothetical protein [Pedobacter alpinus]|uniref:Uncharacterized protein n=1 Tax=Pedobacter alpinus TaxID=1590643 RepID=A0ABW5TLV0_9SPHI